MQKIRKPLFVIIAIQVVCLALGMYLHGCFVFASAKWAAQEEVWNALVVWADMSRDEPEQLLSGNAFDMGGTTASQMNRAGRQPADARFGLLTVNDNWLLDGATESALSNSTAQSSRNQSRRNQSRRNQSGSWIRDQVIVWKGPALQESPGKELTRGELQTPDGTRIALARELKGGNGYAIFYLLDEDIQLSAAAVLGSMPAAGAITVIWIGGLQCVAAFLLLSRMSVEHTRVKIQWEEETLQRKSDLIRTRDAVIFGLAKLADSRDSEIGNHLERISLYSTRLAMELRRDPEYRDRITPAFIRLIGISSALHDIGKVGVADSILRKPGKLSDAERFLMQVHVQVGGDCIREIEQRLGSSNFLEMAREIAFSHHEHWDGAGYPAGIAGEDIPLSARIVAVADVYDALSVKRVYKEPYSHEKCVRMIREESGKHFDPGLVAAFLRIESQIRGVSEQYRQVSPDPTDPADEAEQSNQHMTLDQEITLIASMIPEEPTLEPAHAIR